MRQTISGLIVAAAMLAASAAPAMACGLGLPLRPGLCPGLFGLRYVRWLGLWRLGF